VNSRPGTTTTELRWDILPPDFIADGEYASVGTLGEWVFKEGKATITLRHPEDPLREDTLGAAFNELESILLSMCLHADRSYTLSDNPAITQHNVSGINYILVAGAVHYKLEMGRVDVAVHERVGIQIKDNVVIADTLTGRVLYDSAAERVAAQRKHIEGLAPVLAGSTELLFMAKSYRRSFEDPANALVHLGEIKDILSQVFGGAKAAEKKLPSEAFNALGRIANGLPVNEGRHRGAHYEGLRPATAAELREARNAARELIEAYKGLVSQ
jgi:hypothetical protein